MAGSARKPLVVVARIGTAISRLLPPLSTGGKAAEVKMPGKRCVGSFVLVITEGIVAMWSGGKRKMNLEGLESISCRDAGVTGAFCTAPRQQTTIKRRERSVRHKRTCI